MYEVTLCLAPVTTSNALNVRTPLGAIETWQNYSLHTQFPSVDPLLSPTWGETKSWPPCPQSLLQQHLPMRLHVTPTSLFQ